MKMEDHDAVADVDVKDDYGDVSGDDHVDHSERC